MVTMLTAPGLTLLFLGVVVGLGTALVDALGNRANVQTASQ
jgi:hypothetical protein